MQFRNLETVFLDIENDEFMSFASREVSIFNQLFAIYVD